MEKSEIHGIAVGRRVCRAGHQRHQIRAVRGAAGLVYRGSGSTRHAARRPLYLSREHAQNRGPAHPPRVLHRRSTARHARSRGCRRTQTAVLDCRTGTEAAAQKTAQSRMIPDLVLIPGGSFLMGQEDGRDEERPVHRVIVSPFRLCRFQVTNCDFLAFRKFAAANPILPVTSVSWFDASEYCRWLSAQWSMELRLPTEAEWEFAARGGMEQKLYPWGDSPVRSEERRVG